MELFVTIVNENNRLAFLSGDKNLVLTLDCEEPSQSWQRNDSSHELKMFWRLNDEGKATLTIRGNPDIIIEDKRQD